MTTFRLIRPSAAQIWQAAEYEWPHWGPKLTNQAYHQREVAVQALGKTLYFALVAVAEEDQNLTDEELQAKCDPKTGLLGACQLMERSVLASDGAGNVKEVKGACVCSVFVGPEHRGKGYGQKVRDLVQLKADELGFEFVCLYSEVGNFYAPNFVPYPSTIAMFNPMTNQEAEAYRSNNLTEITLDKIDEVLQIDQIYARQLVTESKVNAFVIPYTRSLFDYFLARQRVYEDDFKVPRATVHGVILSNSAYCIWHADFPAQLLRILRLRGTLTEKTTLVERARKEAFDRGLEKGVYLRDHEKDLAQKASVYREETDCISCVKFSRPDLVAPNSLWLLNEKFCWS